MNETLLTRRNTARIFGAATTCILAVIAPSPTQAATGDGDWQWNATVYVWLPSLGGETSFPPSGGGPSIDVSADAILDSLNFAFMGAFEGRKGRWGLATDVIYLDLGASKKATRDFGIGQVDIPATVNADLRLDITGWLWTLAGSYAVVQQENFSMNVLGGVRMLDLEETLQWQFNGDIASLPIEGRTGSSSAEDTLWDAIVGVKGRWTLGADRQWYVPYYLDVGTGDSDLTWQGMAGLGYSFDSIDVTGVWRYLDYDLGDSQPIRSIDFNGPALGVTFRF
ncbi:MAG: hypothetical protein OEY13_03315 [Gammaproteobacteria bacterium]|nr:hypothetical protein [Aquincola sp.]MDH5272086.1 hypothetical protein [Gammaproteobacteria bacterium]